MSITREEAIKVLENERACVLNDTCQRAECANCALVMETEDVLSALDLALTALRGPTREMVERMRGEWVMKHRHHGGFRRVTGTDDMGERHTITIDERCEYDDRYCPKCGKQSPDNFLNFCGYCGALMTDEAVDMMRKRMEEMTNEH